MFKFLLAAVFAVFCLSTLAVTATPIKSIDLSETGLRSAFGQFIYEHKRVYSCPMEHENRYAIFKANLLRAAEWQEDTKSAIYGVTPFSDRTDEENFAKLTGFKHPTAEQRAKRPTYSEIEPAVKKASPYNDDLHSFDWRGTPIVSPVKDQGDCGSCSFFSVIASLGSSAAKQGYTLPFDLSAQQLVDCAPGEGCSGSTPEMIGDYLTELEVTGGLQSNTSYPYKARTMPCHYNSSNVHVPFNWYRWVIPPCDDEGDCSIQDGKSALMKIVEINQVPSVCLYANSKWFSYVGGVFDDKNCHNDFGFLNHCVALVGYSQLEQAVIIQNSWGTDWGNNGYIFLKTDFLDEDYKNLCGVFDYLTYFNAQTPHK